jgi:hypothetical protein
MFKQLLDKMGINTKKIVTGEEAKRQMDLQQAKAQANLTEQEINFILTKLRAANYSGAEFEMFHSVWMKLTDLKG